MRRLNSTKKNSPKKSTFPPFSCFLFYKIIYLFTSFIYVRGGNATFSQLYIMILSILLHHLSSISPQLTTLTCLAIVPIDFHSSAELILPGNELLFLFSIEYYGVLICYQLFVQVKSSLSMFPLPLSLRSSLRTVYLFSCQQ